MTDAYEHKKSTERARQAAASAKGRDIGPVPSVINPERRASCERDFRLFCETYFPEAFYLPWSPDHLKVIAKIEAATLRGDQFAHAMPRGSGKTTLTETASLWAVLYAHRRFVVLIGATASRGMAMLASIKTSVENNERLIEDFPEVCYPVARLERIGNRAHGQTCDGAPTLLTWKDDKIILPTVPGSAVSGAILTATGLEGGEIRGQKHKRADGVILRPDLAVIDDPQTAESAWSESQCARREALLAGDVLGMAGPGQKIAAIMPCTVIRAGDMADNILDREKHPEWHGERTKMVYAWPTATKLWDEYLKIRAESLKADGDGAEATEFYREHREEMDVGAAVAWPERHNADELSALQHAMNLRMRDEAAFFAEYQNEPQAPNLGDEATMTADEIAEKMNGRARGTVPTACQWLTAFIDVHDRLLYWSVCGWAQNFTGYVVDYGTYPDQGRPRFAMHEAKRTLGRAAPGAGKEGAILAGIVHLVGEFSAREWPRDDGTKMQIGRMLVDCGHEPDVVFQAIRKAGRGGAVMPARGYGVTAAGKPFSEYARKAGDLAGLHWRIPAATGRDLRTVNVDTNYWKSFIHARLATALGDGGCLSLPGAKASEHRLFGEHLAAEYRVRTEGRGRSVEEWKLKAGWGENHWLDCCVGCSVGAAMSGAILGGMAQPKKIKKARKRVAYL